MISRSYWDGGVGGVVGEVVVSKDLLWPLWGWGEGGGRCFK